MRFLSIAVVFLSLSTLAKAQDAASTPFRPRSPATARESPPPVSTPESEATQMPEPIEPFTLQPMESPILDPIPTASIEPFSTPRVQPVTVSSPAPEPTATPVPIASPSPSLIPAVAPRPQPSPSQIPTATPPPATPVTEVSPAADPKHEEIVSKLTALERRWEGLFLTHDISVIEELVADDFIGTSSGGRLGNKEMMIAQARKDKNHYTSADSDELVVHVFSTTMAVVTGVARETGKTPAGKSFSRSLRFTDTWMEREGKWQCVAASAMAVPKK